MKLLRLLLTASLILRLFPIAYASSVLPLSESALVRSSDAVLRGRVVGSFSFKSADGLIYTRTSLRVDEGFKGKFPRVMAVVHRGGRVGEEDEFYGLSPKFDYGEEVLLFVTRGGNGTLRATQGDASAMKLRRSNTGAFVAEHEALLARIRQLTSGDTSGADVTDQTGMELGPNAAPTGMLGGVLARFTQPDRGEPIPFLIDATSLPTGITLTQATNAVQQALNAWTSVTSLKFQFEGLQNFGQGADLVTATDQKLRIQLHDNYNSISNLPNVLGIGGRSGSTSPISGVGWDLGGNVAGNEFIRTSRGYVVLEHTNTSLQVLATFTEVLCHEIGHALNLAHSSEDPGEPSSLLKQAVMYFQVHGDGRGATLGAYDPPIIQQIYPTNTPPYSYPRVMDVTTAGNAPNVSGINEVELRGYDLQTTNLSFATANQTANNGSFSLASSLLKFIPNYTAGSRIDPAGTSFYDMIAVRFSDGTNGSPYILVRVLSLNPDSDFPVSDGLPDNWMTANFGHANPQAADKSRAADDKDTDRLTNLQEYIAGMDPKDTNSVQRITLVTQNAIQWQAKAYELYVVEGTTNLVATNWKRVGNPVLPTNSVAMSTNLYDSTKPVQFFRIQKVP